MCDAAASSRSHTPPPPPSHPRATDINKAEAARAQCAHQFSENDMVAKELERLEADAAVFKLVGPVLIRQDLVEARANVAKRLEYISGERRVAGGRGAVVASVSLARVAFSVRLCVLACALTAGAASHAQRAARGAAEGAGGEADGEAARGAQRCVSPTRPLRLTARREVCRFRR